MPLSYGLQLSVECCVVGLLELFGRAVLKATVQSTVVVRDDTAGGGPLDMDDARAGTVVEHRGADALGLEPPVHALHERVDAPIAVKRPSVGPVGIRAGVAGVTTLRGRGGVGGSGCSPSWSFLRLSGG